MTSISGNQPTPSSPATQAPTDHSRTNDTIKKPPPPPNPEAFSGRAGRSALDKAEDGLNGGLLKWVDHIFDKMKTAIPGVSSTVNSRSAESGGDTTSIS